MKPVRTVARALLAAVFVRGGLDAYKNPDRYLDGAQAVTDRWTPTLNSLGLPTDPRSLARATGVVQMVGGVLLGTNTAVGPAALALAGTLVPSTLAGRDVWSPEPGDTTGRPILDRPELLKNLGLLGGLLLAAVDTEGKPGVAWRTGHLAEHAQDTVKRAAHTTAKETKRAAHTTAKETKRAVHLTAKEAKRAADDARRAARTATREAKFAVKSTPVGGVLTR
jgi:uncharacterized membrane protein YphA (DoxX/SURF4 family)